MSKHIKRYVISLGIYFLISLGIYVFYCDDCFSDARDVLRNLSFSMVMAMALSEGNGRLSGYLDKKYSWIDQTFMRVLSGVVILVLYSVLATAVVGYIFIVWVWGFPVDQVLPNLPPLLTSALIITAIIVLISYTAAFLGKWREAAIQTEKLKNEQLSAKFSSLKNQLNPHFLFNSLNALSSLVYIDADQSAQFIKQLSEVYRYILEYSDREIVSLKLEMACVEAYIYLMKIRFGENFQIHSEVNEQSKWMLAPMSVQMLIENAIKHNIISAEHPLSIHIYRDNDYIIVSNKLQKRSHMESSTGVGLNNISERYRYLTDKVVITEEIDGQFIVKLPLLSWKYESTDR